MILLLPLRLERSLMAWLVFDAIALSSDYRFVTTRTMFMRCKNRHFLDAYQHSHQTNVR